MSTCPVCRAAWPQAIAMPSAVCASCYSVFEWRDGQWQQTPPGWHKTWAVPFPIGTILRLRSVDHRVVGFARYSYQVEYGRDQWDEFERHEYTLTDLTGSNPRLLCWTSNAWFLARPVDPALVTANNWAEVRYDGRNYQRVQSQSFTSDWACGYLTHPFQWRQTVPISDFLSDRYVIANEHSGREFRWVGEQVDSRELATALALPELPAIYRTSSPQPPPMVQTPPMAYHRPTKASSLRLAGVLLMALAILIVIGSLAYQYDRRTKPVASHWMDCNLKASTQSFRIPAAATRLEIDPHFPMGSLNYRVRVLDAQGTELETRRDFLDMHPKRRTLAMELPERAASVEVTGTLSIRVKEMDHWPVEVRFLP